jgi:hypothetical protein
MRTAHAIYEALVLLMLSLHLCCGSQSDYYVRLQNIVPLGVHGKKFELANQLAPT